MCIRDRNEYSQGHDHDSSISWKPLSEINDAIDSGYYYLTGDIHTTSEWKINSTVALCLNGYSIICDSDTAAINIGRSGQLTITDCSADEKGTITHSDGKNGRGIYSMGKLDLWRGSVAGNQYYVKIDYSSPDDYYDYYDRPVDYGTGKMCIRDRKYMNARLQGMLLRLFAYKREAAYLQFPLNLRLHRF